jgi:hypothetical protein
VQREYLHAKNGFCFLIGINENRSARISIMLAQLRPSALMLVIATAEEYIGDMLAALRA